MGEGKKQVFEGPKFKAYIVKEEAEEKEDQEDQALIWGSSASSSCSSSSFSSFSTMEDDDDDDDDASSSSPQSSSPNSTPSSLNDLSQLMTQLPIKRGLSKFYNGKSESFTNLARVTSIEDLAKKENPYDSRRRLLKACKSHGGGLDSYKSLTSPKPIISKKNSFSFNRRPSFVTVSRPPPLPY